MKSTGDTAVEPSRPFDRLVFLQNGFFSERGHWMHEVRSWRKAVLKAKMEWHGLANTNLPVEIAQREGVDPCIPFLPGQTLRGLHQGQRLAAFLDGYERLPTLLAKHYPGTPSPKDLIHVAYATDVEMIGLAKWLEGIPEDKRPSVAFTFHHPSHEWTTDRKSLKLEGDAHRWIYAMERLGACSRKIRYFSSLPALSRELSRLLRTEILTLSHTCQLPEENVPENPEKVHDFGILGGGRKGQGVDLWPEIASRLMSANGRVRILLQSPPEDEGAAFREMAKPGLTSGHITIPEAEEFTDAGFLRKLSSCRILLMPYDPLTYALRSSGIFLEAACLGIPVIAHSGTSMGRMILSGLASGMTYDRQNSEEIARIAGMALESVSELSGKAHALKGGWRSRLSASTLLAELCSAFSA